MTVLELTLPPVPASIAQARHTVERLADAVPDAVLERLRLLVSEVVTNSVRHGGVGPIQLRIRATSGIVRVEVEDRGPGFEPDLDLADADLHSGWGLFLVDRLTARWGVTADRTTTVWFELDRRAA
jgi:anti-sigma regulatory factor (Ser/Thr protein kinase)